MSENTEFCLDGFKIVMDIWTWKLMLGSAADGKQTSVKDRMPHYHWWLYLLIQSQTQNPPVGDMTWPYIWQTLSGLLQPPLESRTYFTCAMITFQLHIFQNYAPYFISFLPTYRSKLLVCWKVTKYSYKIVKFATPGEPITKIQKKKEWSRNWST